MSFSKKTWADRTTQYPNRRQLTDESGTVSLVTVVRSEGTITTEGDAFNATNMNDLEDRIEDAVGKYLTKQTLTAGDTELTFTDSAIETDSIITPYTTTFGIAPTDVTTTAGQVVLTFDAQDEDVDVTIKVESGVE